MGVGAAMVSANWVVLSSLGGSHITPCGDVCSDVEASGEMDVGTRACSLYGGLWWHGRWCYGLCCVDLQVEAVFLEVSPIEDVGWLNPVS
jgi:hypothetical protein